jgi:hypothetical protein
MLTVVLVLTTGGVITLLTTAAVAGWQLIT